MSSARVDSFDENQFPNGTIIATCTLYILLIHCAELIKMLTDNMDKMQAPEKNDLHKEVHWTP